MSNVHGRATAITVLTPIKPGWTLWLRPNFWAGERFPFITKTLRDLSFIHFARWSIIDRIPFNGPPQDRERLNYSYLFFESNFNGSWDQYIDAFSHILPSRMRAVWGSSYGFPGPVPVAPFKRYILQNEFTASHYYSAYPEATTTTILSALALRPRLAALARQARTLPAAEFAARYRDFMTTVQRHV